VYNTIVLNYREGVVLWREPEREEELLLIDKIVHLFAAGVTLLAYVYLFEGEMVDEE